MGQFLKERALSQQRADKSQRADAAEVDGL